MEGGVVSNRLVMVGAGCWLYGFNHAAASHAQVVRTMNSHRCVGFKHWHGLMTSILLKFQHEVGFEFKKVEKIYSEKYSKKYPKKYSYLKVLKKVPKKYLE